MRIEKLKQNFNIDVQLVHFPLHPETPMEGRSVAEMYASRGLDPKAMYERMKGLSEEEAVAEADRCMSCGMCFECDNCVIFCPQDAVYRVPKKDATMGRYVATDYAKCVGCHICADVCPTGYIDMAMGE